MRKKLSALAQRREKLGLTQFQMATLLRTVQSEVSKSEAGALPAPADIPAWARAYKVSIRKFEAECLSAAWVLPLWSMFLDSPAQIEHFDFRVSVKERTA
jgi:transcriptional regulator with XRE-family HTH domain